MPTRNVVLTDHQSALIDRLVAEGRYQNASEALRAGLRLLEKDEESFDRIKAGVQEGVRQALNGEFAEGSGEEAVRRAFEEARAEYRSRNG